VCSVKVDVVGVDPLAAVENLEGDDVVDVVGAAELGGVRRPGGPEVLVSYLLTEHLRCCAAPSAPSGPRDLSHGGAGKQGLPGGVPPASHVAVPTRRCHHHLRACWPSCL
jgi:hypothetical protein